MSTIGNPPIAIGGRRAGDAGDVIRAESDAPDEVGPGSFRTAAIAGSFWVIAGYGASQVFRLGGNLVLAWLVAPSAFGLMLLVNTVLHGLAMFSDIGIGPSIIQNKRGTTPEFLRTAWTIQIIRGFILWVACAALAWPIAALFARNDPTYAQLAYLLPVAGLSAVIAGFNSPALFILNRRLAIGRLTRIELASQVVGVGTMIVWGLAHPTVWALLAGGLATVMAKMILSHAAIVEHRMSLRWHPESARALFQFGKWIFASTLVTFLATNLDKAVLGTLLSAEVLGLYAIALVFAKFTMHIGQRLSSTIIFPVLSRFQDDPAKVVSMCIRSRRAVLWMSGAACAAFTMAGPLFFETLYDVRYHHAGEIARWLSMYIWVAVLITSMDQIPLALGAPRTLFVANFIKGMGIVPAAGGYLLGGLVGFIVGLTCVWLVALAYLIHRMPVRRLAMARQTIAFTIGWGAFVVPAVAFVDQLAGLGRAHEVVGTLAMTAAPMLAAAVALWRLEGRSTVRALPERDLRAAAPAELT